MDTSEKTELKDAFRKVAVRHQSYAVAMDQFSEAIEDFSDKSLVVLAGPTGAGKSTLAVDVSSVYLDEHKAQMEADATLRPMIWTLATASDNIAFDFARMWRDGLIALGDPLAAIRQYRNDGRKGTPKHQNESPVAALVREVLETELRNRGTRIWGIDEAHHVVRGGRGEPGDQLDVVKSVTQTTSSRLILVGTGDLPNYLFASGQVARRSGIIYLNAYRYALRRELGYFIVAAENLLRRLPSRPSYPDVQRNAELYFTGCLGCIGTLKDWIARAHVLMLDEGKNKLTLKHLVDKRLGQRAIRKIHREIVLVQEQFQDDRRLPKALRSAILTGRREEGEEANYINPPTSARRTKPTQPGVPIPVRHAVGRYWG